MGLFFGGHDPSSDNLTDGSPRGPDDFQYGGKGQDQAVTGHDDWGDITSGVAGTSSAEQEAARYGNMGIAAMGRGAPTTDYTQGDAAAAQGLGARSGQGDALGMIRQRAMGGGASAATLGMNQGNDQAAQGQLAMMAGARPGSAVAGQQAAGQGSMSQVANIGQAGQMRSGEISGAQQGMLGGYADMRGGDINAMKMQDARSQHMANMIMGQRGLNQQAGLNYEGMRMGAQQAQLGANEYARQSMQRHIDAQRAMDQAAAQHSAGNAQQLISGASSAASGGMTAASRGGEGGT